LHRTNPLTAHCGTSSGWCSAKASLPMSSSIGSSSCPEKTVAQVEAVRKRQHSSLRGSDGIELIVGTGSPANRRDDGCHFALALAALLLSKLRSFSFTRWLLSLVLRRCSFLYATVSEIRDNKRCNSAASWRAMSPVAWAVTGPLEQSSKESYSRRRPTRRSSKSGTATTPTHIGFGICFPARSVKA